MEQITLGELITVLAAADPEDVVPFGFSYPHSSRAVYANVAFEPGYSVRVGNMLADARGAVGTTYQGWKGGYFTMGLDTPVWVAQVGTVGEELDKDVVRYMLSGTRARRAAQECSSDPKPPVPPSLVRVTGTLRAVGESFSAVAAALEEHVKALREFAAHLHPETEES